MSNKLITTEYSTVSASINIPSTTANIDKYTDYIATYSTIPVNVSKDTYINNSVIVKVGNLEETSIPTQQQFIRRQDIGSISDKLIYLKYLKNIPIDSIGTSDIFAAKSRFSRIFSDIRNTSDTLNASSTKYLLDISQYRELFNKSIYTSYTSKNTSLIDLHNIYSLKKVTSSSLSLDSNIFSVNKNITSPITPAEYLDRVVAFNRDLLDIIDATDDYYGTSTVDDDQYTSLAKTLITYSTLLDTQYANYVAIKASPVLATSTESYNSKLLKLDYINIYDSTIYKPNKKVAEYVYKSDSTYKQVLKPISSAITATTDKDYFNIYADKFTGTNITEQSYSLLNTTLQTEYINYYEVCTPVWSAFRYYTSNSLVSDSSNVLSLLSKTNTLTNTDILDTYVSKYLDSISNALEYIELVNDFIRDLNDVIDATDDYLAEASIDDGQVASLLKNILEPIYPQEQYSLYASNNYLSQVLISPDILNSLVVKQAADHYSTYDSLQNFILPIVYDTLGTDIHRKYALYSYKSDEISNTELMYLNSSITYTNPVSLNTDSIINNLNSIYTSAPAIQDITNSNILKQYLESQYITSIALINVSASYTSPLLSSDLRDISTAINIFSSTNSIEDYINILRTTSLNVSEAISHFESGFINNQNYFSAAYIEPGYVGTDKHFS